VKPEELAMLLEKLTYLSQGAKAVVFAGSLPRDVDDGFYGEAIRRLNREGIQTVLDSEGQPLRLGVQAEPFLVSPNQREAEGLVGHEFNDDDDFMLGLGAIAERGARNVLITQEAGCFALLREDRTVHRYRARAPQVEPVSAVGSGDVLLAAFLASWLDEKPAEESLRTAVATGAAATLEVGAGRFEPREVGRLTGSVRVDELASVPGER
jgi:fructose-1-phosphate kinase PfkB-like protein